MFEVIGFKPVEYDSKKDGKHKSGAEVYLMNTEPSDRSGVIGAEAMVVWLNREYSTYNPNIGDRVKLCYNRFGRVEDLISVGC